MRKSKLAVFTLTAIISATSYAGWQQDVTVCLNVNNNTTDTPFYAAFVSSDVFDTWTMVRKINGQDCVHHTYNHGPKNLKVRIRADQRYKNSIIIHPELTSCSYLNKADDRAYISNYMTTGRHKEFWTFNITQSPGKEGEKYPFYMSCQHWATD